MSEKELIRDEKEINKLLELQREIETEVAKAINENRSSATVGNRIILIIQDPEDDPNDENILEYKAVSEQGSIEVTTKKDKKTGKILDVDVDFDIKTVNIILDNERRKELENNRRVEKHLVGSRESDLLKKEVEMGLKKGDAALMDTRRENTKTETVGMFLSRAFGERDVDELYKVKGRGSHDFKYVIKKSNGTYKTLDLSTKSEGTNTRQKIWLMKDGKLEEKTVDSLLLKGRYGIATDMPENVATSNTTSYMVQRLPNGQYLAVEMAQARGINRNTSGNLIQKELMSRSKSRRQMEDTVQEAELAKQIEPIMKDGILTTEELELVKKLKEDKNMNNSEVRMTVDTIVSLKDMGFSCDEIKPMLENWEKNEIKAVSEKIKKGDISKSEIEEEDQKLPGGGSRNRGYDPKHDF